MEINDFKGVVIREYRLLIHPKKYFILKYFLGKKQRFLVIKN
jgi:hypothetical protein